MFASNLVYKATSVQNILKLINFVRKGVKKEIELKYARFEDQVVDFSCKKCIKESFMWHFLQTGAY